MPAALFGTLWTFAPPASATSGHPTDRARAEAALQQAQDLASGHSVQSGREYTVELRLDRKTAKKLGVKRVLGTRTVTLKKAGAKSVRVKLGKRARGKLRKRGASVPVSAHMRATRGSAHSASHTRKLRLRR